VSGFSADLPQTKVYINIEGQYFGTDDYGYTTTSTKMAWEI
jgi:hypothetical protein